MIENAFIRALQLTHPRSAPSTSHLVEGYFDKYHPWGADALSRSSLSTVYQWLSSENQNGNNSVSFETHYTLLGKQLTTHVRVALNAIFDQYKHHGFATFCDYISDADDECYDSAADAAIAYALHNEVLSDIGSPLVELAIANMMLPSVPGEHEAAEKGFPIHLIPSLALSHNVTSPYVSDENTTQLGLFSQWLNKANSESMRCKAERTLNKILYPFAAELRFTA